MKTRPSFVLKAASLIVILTAVTSCYRMPRYGEDLCTTPITNNPNIIDKVEPTLIPSVSN